MLRRLVPLLVLAGIGWHASATVQRTLRVVSNLKENLVVERQLGVITSSITLAMTDEDRFRVPDNPTEFSSLLRRVVVSRVGGDPALDPWGTPYGHYLVGRTLTVISAGPDRTWRTSDDVSQSVDLPSAVDR